MLTWTHFWQLCAVLLGCAAFLGFCVVISNYLGGDAP